MTKSLILSAMISMSSIFGGGEQQAEELGKLKQENTQLRQELATIRRDVARMELQDQGNTFVMVHGAVILIILMGVLWLIVVTWRSKCSTQ